MNHHVLFAMLYAGFVWGITGGCLCVLALKMYRFSLTPRGAGKPICSDCKKSVSWVTVLSERRSVCDDCWDYEMRNWRGNVL